MPLMKLTPVTFGAANSYVSEVNDYSGKLLDWFNLGWVVWVAVPRFAHLLYLVLQLCNDLQKWLNIHVESSNIQVCAICVQYWHDDAIGYTNLSLQYSCISYCVVHCALVGQKAMQAFILVLKWQKSGRGSTKAIRDDAINCNWSNPITTLLHFLQYSCWENTIKFIAV